MALRSCSNVHRLPNALFLHLVGQTLSSELMHLKQQLIRNVMFKSSLQLAPCCWFSI